MKISICQINPSVGAINYNYKKIIKFYKKSLFLGADIIIFPELSITGYPPKDLLFEKKFIDKNLMYAEKLSKVSTKPIIFGYVSRNKGKLYNSAGISFNGKLRYVYNKKLLPNYDVFDENRYFFSGKDVGVYKLIYNNTEIKIGLQICEDLWDDNQDVKVSEEQKENGAEILINISASPFSEGKLEKRVELIKRKIKDLKLPFVYCNMVGAQDEIIFDGSSLAFSNDGNLIKQAKYFKECISIINFKVKKSCTMIFQKREKKIFNALCLGVSDYFSKTGYKEAVLGLSGGIDSALTAVIAVEALGSNNVHGVLLPSKYSSDHSLKDAECLASNLKIDYRTISIQKSVDVLLNSLNKEFLGKEKDTTEENIQSRVRGNILMALSNKFGWLLLTTGNKTEIALGYCTLYGDMNGGLAVISDVNKLDVYALSRWYNKLRNNIIPVNSIEKIPSAELSYNQVDPFDYKIISPLVDSIIENKIILEELVTEKVNLKLLKSIYKKIKINEFKRYQSAVGLKISDKAFGIGRRFPIVNNFNI
jgi:NAD+ synthase (glutamine-hydrolysing)